MCVVGSVDSSNVEDTPAVVSAHEGAADETSEPRGAPPVRIRVTSDSMQAFLEWTGSCGDDDAVVDEVLVVSLLNENGVVVDDTVRERVAAALCEIPPSEALLEAVASGADLIESHDISVVADSARDSASDGRFPGWLIAEGRVPTDAEDAKLEWFDQVHPDACQTDEEERVDHYLAKVIRTIDAGSHIGRVIPARDGVDGVDVFGQVLASPRREGTSLVLGHGLRMDQNEADVVVMDVAGRVVQDGATFYVDEVLIVESDVNFASGSVDASTSVRIRGDVRPHFRVRSTKSIQVEGAVEAAEVQAGEDLIVRGGIFGHDSGTLVSAGGELETNICDSALVRVRGKVNVTREIINSDVVCEATVTLEHGAIIGGVVSAGQGFLVQTLGSPAGVETRVALGAQGEFLAQIESRRRAAERKRAQAQRLLERVAPFQRDFERLSSDHRQMVESVRSAAERMTSQADALDEERLRQLQGKEMAQLPVINVLGTVHAGVIIAMGIRLAVISEPMRGPLIIEPRVIEGAVRLVAACERTGALTQLAWTDETETDE